MPLPRVARLEPGYTVDGLYEIQERIGAGGMATVYKALQGDTGKSVALKLIDLGDQDVSDTRRRFFNELLLATRVRHPNIVGIYDFGLLTSIGAPYIVMELLTGANLRQYIRRFGPLLLEEAIPLFLGALGALRDAHEQGVVHKDLKPSNLFLCSQPKSDESSMVIVDFGIAARVREGQIGGDAYHGTPRYSAPEYIRDHAVGPRLDVYQMGLVFCEAISGKPVVNANTELEMFRMHLAGQLDVPRACLGPRMCEVIDQALAMDPANRFPHAGAFYDALRQAAGTDASPTLRRLTSTPPPIRSDTASRIASTMSQAVEDEEEDASLPTGILDWGESTASSADTAPVEPSPHAADTDVLPQTKPPEAPPPQPSRVLYRSMMALMVFGMATVCFGSGALLMWLVTR